MRRLLLGITLVAFSALTVGALWQHGYAGIVEYQFQNLGGLLVVIDLLIALSLFLVWMWRDAQLGRHNPWLWLVFILATGSIGALVYVLMYKTNESVTSQ